MYRVCHAFLSVHCSLVVTCWERANFLALLYVKFACVFVTFPFGVLGLVWYLIVSIPDLCLLTFCNQTASLYKMFYTSAHMKLNLLNELGKIDIMRCLPSIVSPFCKELNKLNK